VYVAIQRALSAFDHSDDSFNVRLSEAKQIFAMIDECLPCAAIAPYEY
jgi:hypothetical protein